MGCTSSISYMKKSCTHINNYTGSLTVPVALTFSKAVELTDAEKQTVRQSWLALAKDLQGNGLQIFLRIFEMCPEAKALFSVENVRHSKLARNETIKAHSARFINVIGAAVENLDGLGEKDNTFCKLLFELGQRHRHFKGFKPEYFNVFYQAMMWQWARCMGDQFTTEVSDTWGHVFVYLMEKLTEGYYSQEEIRDKVS